jgi:hypothetical protein
MGAGPRKRQHKIVERLYPFAQASLQCIAKLRNYGTANEQY